LNFGLGQLSSPAASARRLANWFIDEFNCSEWQLASVSLLLSESNPASFTNPKTGVTHSVPRGTRLETRDELIATLGRARRSDDQFLFYFAGHGLGGGVNDFYLLRDFGRDPNGPLDAMINYADLMAAMKTQIPSQQLLVFDGCRDVNDLIDANWSGGTGLTIADPGARLGVTQPMRQCGIHSAERDAKSYGKKGAPSVCAQALERALSGAAGKAHMEGWYVTSGRICEAMCDFQTLGFGPNAGIVQRPDPSAYADFKVRRLTGPPRVPVFMRRIDGGSLKGSTVTCRANGMVVLTEAPVREWYWEGALEIGKHDFEVVLAAGGQCRPVTGTVSPTHLPIQLEVP
jgi:hypothetical protein